MQIRAQKPSPSSSVGHRFFRRPVKPLALAARAVVCVPARDEEARLPALLTSLAAQRGPANAPLPLPLPVVLCLNNCRDRSNAVVAALLRGNEEVRRHLRLFVLNVDLSAQHAHVGTARRLAMETGLTLFKERSALQRSESSDGSGVGALLTTDADAVLPPDWLIANCRALAAGADAVGGRIVGVVEEETRLPPDVRQRACAFRTYRALCDRLEAIIDPLSHDPMPRHWDHLGASLAVRTDVYERVGGLPALPRREDLALVSRIRAIDGRVRHCPGVEVRVSVRMRGRASGGMADAICQWWRERHRPQLVECPRRVERRARLRRVLRDLGTEASVASPVAGWLLSGEPGRGRLIEQLAPEEPDAPATVPVGEAIARLSRRLSKLGAIASAVSTKGSECEANIYAPPRTTERF